MFKIYFLISFILIQIPLFSQAEYVRVNNPVYPFLERMETLHLIYNYNSFEIPKTRKMIASYLKELINNIEKLDNTDKNILEDLKTEFENDLYGTVRNSQSIIGNGSYNIFSDKEKYLFIHTSPTKANIFINLVSEGELIFRNDDEPRLNSSTTLGLIGGEIRGTLVDKFGFYLKGFQGKVFGNTSTAMLRKDIKYNFKFNLVPDEAFFDETEGYLTADFDLVKFKIGRDRVNIGYGNIKPILSDNSPIFDYLSFNINYEFLTFSFLYGKILGDKSVRNDPVNGSVNVVAEKYMGYHRIGFNISPSFNFGIGEVVIYGNRPIDLSYLNPFALYKSVEHSNQDRDNSMMFFDINSKIIKGLKAYAFFLLDDISFGKIGSGWYGNQTLLNIGLYSANLYILLPIDIRFDYLRIEPYTFTHRIPGNNFTNDGYNLSSEMEPNSELFFCEINYRFNYRLSTAIGFGYSVHGANLTNSEGNVIKNVGGDISVGHRVFDSETVHFLEGESEYKRSITFALIYEPVNQVIFHFNLAVKNESLQRLRNKTINTFLILEIKL